MNFLLMRMLLLAATLISVNCPINAIYDPHFYRAGYFYFEPRFEKKGLTSFDVTFGGGSTTTARNECGKKTSLLNSRIELPESKKITQSDISNYNAQNDKNCTSPCEKFSIIEATFLYTQNIYHGLFTQFFVPIKRIEITDTRPNLCPFKESGVGDAIGYIGWAKNYEETIKLDYIDFTAKIGALIPIADQKNHNQPLAIPLGYNKHPGLAFTLDSSLGAYDWLTVGAHFGALTLFEKQIFIRMQIDQIQESASTFNTGTAREHAGSVAQAAAYAKADHLVRGFSLLTGYSFTKKGDDCITPCNEQLFNTHNANQNSNLSGWDMHVIHLFAEYDFTQENMKFGPRIGLFYNHPFAGKQIFITDMKGGTLGLDIDWQF